MIEREITITLVGTSLIRNYLSREKGLDRNCIAEIEKSDECGKVKCYETCNLVNELVSYANKDPYTASAELNALLRYLERLKKINRLPDEMVVKLLVSDTCGGTVAGAALKEFIDRHLLNYIQADVKIYSNVIRVRELGRNFYNGLLNLFCYISYLLNCEKEKKGERSYFSANLTGGFKPEGAYALIPLTLHAMRVKAAYYIHENFRELVLLPLIPSTVDQAILNYLAESPSMEIIGKSGLVVGEYAKKLINCIKYGEVCGRGIEYAVEQLSEEKLREEVCK